MANEKLLLVEDDVMLIEMMKMNLEAQGYQVITAENGKDGAFKAISEKPDLILADLMMPELDGFEMIKLIRSNSDLKDTPIICVTALGREEDIEKATAAGATDYITKPYVADDLVKKIQTYLK
jgi:two-component system alkaline phosphatase synthesis response regulator PhoP